MALKCSTVVNCWSVLPALGALELASTCADWPTWPAAAYSMAHCPWAGASWSGWLAKWVTYWLADWLGGCCWVWWVEWGEVLQLQGVAGWLAAAGRGGWEPKLLRLGSNLLLFGFGQLL